MAVFALIGFSVVLVLFGSKLSLHPVANVEKLEIAEYTLKKCNKIV